MLVHDLKLIHGESRAGRELHDVLRRRHLPARKYLLTDEPHEPQITHSDRDTVLGPIARRMGEYRLQYHAAIVGQDSVGHVEERRVPGLPNASKASMLTMRSTGSSNCSHPRRNTRRERSVWICSKSP